MSSLAVAANVGTSGNRATRSPRWHHRRQDIIDTSACAFAERGYHATSTKELCDLNGIRKGTLYYYFGSKQDLLAAIYDRVMDEVMLGADRVAARGGSATQQLRMHGVELLGVIARFPDHVWVFLHDFPALTGSPAAAFRKRRRAYELRIEAVFEVGIQSGAFRPLDPRLATVAWLGMHNCTYVWFRSAKRVSVSDVATGFADAFLLGIVAPTLTPT